MLKKPAVLLEVACAIAAAVLAILWARNPQDDLYEPYVAVCAAVLVGLDLFRRYTRSSRLRIFLSVGATYTEEREVCVKDFEMFLAAKNMERLVVGRDKPSSRQPILEVKDRIRESDAVVVLAFTRYTIAAGLEKPGANLPGHNEKEITNARHPTVWNQIEAGIAFGLGKPLLVILEEGMEQEAMLKDRLEFRTITSSFKSGCFQTQQFIDTFNDFESVVKRRSWFRL